MDSERLAKLTDSEFEPDIIADLLEEINRLQAELVQARSALEKIKDILIDEPYHGSGVEEAYSTAVAVLVSQECAP